MNSYKKILSILGILVISGLFLTACESISQFHLGPKLGIKIPIEEELPLEEGAPSSDSKKTSKTTQTEETGTVMFSQLDNKEELQANAQVMQNKSYIGSGKFTTRQAKKESPQSGDDGKYSINFDAADIGEISKIILSDMLNENYILSP